MQFRREAEGAELGVTGRAERDVAGAWFFLGFNCGVGAVVVFAWVANLLTDS